MNNAKLDSIYNDVSFVKSIFRGFLIGAGTMSVIILIALLYFFINAIFVWNK